jgi:DNA-binding transcriptional LysR family regulator
VAVRAGVRFRAKVGRVLSREARVALEAVSAAALRTQRAGTPDPRLILAMKPGGDAGLLPAILAAYEREPEVLPVEVVFGAGPSRMPRDGQADAALLYAPPDELGGLDTEPLLTEALQRPAATGRRRRSLTSTRTSSASRRKPLT